MRYTLELEIGDHTPAEYRLIGTYDTLDAVQRVVYANRHNADWHNQRTRVKDDAGRDYVVMQDGSYLLASEYERLYVPDAYTTER